MKNIAVFISGNGSNFQALIDANLNCNIALVISNNKDAYGILRAKKHGINYEIVEKNGMNNDEYSLKIKQVLDNYSIDLIVLAGFLPILTSKLISHYKNKIINIHPSLIPSFCGRGYYGKNVHEAVYNSGVKLTGATVHFVDESVDSGYIINQRSVSIEINDNVDDIAAKVLNIEHQILVESVYSFINDEIEIKDNRAFIKGGNK